MKKILVISVMVLAVLLTLTLSLSGVAFAAGGHNCLEMSYCCVTGERHNLDNKCWCGPSSGISIGWYYKTRDPAQYGCNYPNLPSPQWNMYDSLWDYMDTGITGYTDPYNYGPGFVEMALHYGYDNFNYVYDENVTHEDYDEIKDAINNGWPVALTAMGMLSGFSGVDAIWTDEQSPTNHWPCPKWHNIAIKGYYDGFMGHAHVVICTDSWSGANNLYLDWDQLVDVVGDQLKTNIIKDVDPDGDGPYVEDFEWGNYGDSLTDWQNYGNCGGEVDWEAYASGASVAKIDTAQNHTGTKSARFYRDGSNTMYAYYKLWQPSYIGFFLMKDDTAYPEFSIGDGSNYIWVRIDDAEKVTYFGSDGYHTLQYYTLPVNSWVLVEFKNINWTAATYDIYIDGYWKATATMRYGVGYKGNLYFGSWTGSGTFWIDDIAYYFGSNLFVVIEDFEWGSAGTSLDVEPPLGNIDWTVTRYQFVAASATIDTSQYHSGTGTRSAKFYKADIHDHVEAYYPEYRPIWRGFWVMTDGNASPLTITGDGQNIIFVHVAAGGTLQYMKEIGGWQSTNCTLTPYRWYFIEFRNINWETATYSIYVNGNLVQDGVPMWPDTWDYIGETVYGNWDYPGSFWIDDISEPGEPAVDVEKYVKDNSGAWQDADNATGPYIPSSQAPVLFKFTIQNTGNMALIGVTLTDTAMTTFYTNENCTDPASFPTTLAVDETKTFFGKLAWASGQHYDLATAVGQPLVGESISDNDPAYYFGSNPCIRIEKITNGQDADSALGPYIPVGDTVTWVYNVTNCGNVPLSSITVTDSQPGVTPVYVSGDTNLNGQLDLTEAWIYQASSVATAGQYANVGNATGTPPVGAPVSDADPSHYFGSQPSIDVEKYFKDNLGNWTDADNATGPYIPSSQDPVVFKFTIQNTGNVALTGVNLTDTAMGTFYTNEGCTNSTSFPTTLAVNETKTYYGNVAWAAGQQNDTATAVGQPLVGNNVSDNDPAYYFGSQPSIDVEKYVKDSTGTWQDADNATGPYIPSSQDPVVFKFTIQNTGNVALNVTLSDTNMTAFYTDEACTTPASFPTTLAADETRTVYGNVTWTEGQQDDEATAVGTPPVGNNVSDSDPAYYYGSNPCIHIEKLTNGQDADSAPGAIHSSW